MRLSHILEGSSLRRPRVVRQRRVINGRLVSGKLRILDENGRRRDMHARTCYIGESCVEKKGFVAQETSACPPVQREHPRAYTVTRPYYVMSSHLIPLVHVTIHQPLLPRGTTTTKPPPTDCYAILLLQSTLRHTHSAMSLSSQTTLISSSAKHTNPPLHRRPSQHARRRASLHAAHPHAHTHAHAHAHTHAHAPGRRSSEGEAGRRALAAGLAMHTLDQGKKKKQGEVSTPWQVSMK